MQLLCRLRVNLLQLRPERLCAFLLRTAVKRRAGLRACGGVNQFDMVKQCVDIKPCAASQNGEAAPRADFGNTSLRTCDIGCNAEALLRLQNADEMVVHAFPLRHGWRCGGNFHALVDLH